MSVVSWVTMETLSSGTVQVKSELGISQKSPAHFIAFIMFCFAHFFPDQDYVFFVQMFFYI